VVHAGSVILNELLSAAALKILTGSNPVATKWPSLAEGVRGFRLLFWWEAGGIPSNEVTTASSLSLYRTAILASLKIEARKRKIETLRKPKAMRQTAGGSGAATSVSKVIPSPLSLRSLVNSIVRSFVSPEK
jgi:hypothetical protein